MSRVLGIPENKVGDDLTREDTPEWDSFNHLMLVSEIEKEFGVEIPMSEIEHIQSYKDLEKIVSENV